VKASATNSESPACVKNCMVPIIPGPAGTITPTTWTATMVTTISGARWKPNAGARIASPKPFSDPVQRGEREEGQGLPSRADVEGGDERVEHRRGPLRQPRRDGAQERRGELDGAVPQEERGGHREAEGEEPQRDQHEAWRAKSA